MARPTGATSHGHVYQLWFSVEPWNGLVQLHAPAGWQVEPGGTRIPHEERRHSRGRCAKTAFLVITHRSSRVTLRRGMVPPLAAESRVSSARRSALRSQGALQLRPYASPALSNPAPAG